MIFSVVYMQFKMCIEIKLINWNLHRWYFISHFLNQQLCLWRQCGLLGRLQMECVITKIHCPVFPTCCLYHLSSYISHHFTKAFWPYYPCWLYSPQILYNDFVLTFLGNVQPLSVGWLNLFLVCTEPRRPSFEQHEQWKACFLNHIVFLGGITMNE